MRGYINQKNNPGTGEKHDRPTTRYRLRVPCAAWKTMLSESHSLERRMPNPPTVNPHQMRRHRWDHGRTDGPFSVVIHVGGPWRAPGTTYWWLGPQSKAYNDYTRSVVYYNQQPHYWEKPLDA